VDAWAAYRWALRSSVAALAVIAVAVAAVYAFVFGDYWTAANLALFTFAYGGYQFQRAVDYGFGSVPAYARTELVTNGVAVLLAPTVLLSHSLLVFPIIMSYGAFVTASVRRTVRTVTRADRRRAAQTAKIGKSLSRYAAVNGVGTLASMAGLQLSVVVVRHGYESDLSGSYAAAFALLLPLLYLPRAVGTALLPRAAAELREARVRAAQGLERVTAGLLALSLPLALTTAMMAHWIIVVVAGARYGSGATSLQYLLLASFFLIIGVPAVNTLAATGLKGLWVPFWASVAGVGVTAALWVMVFIAGGGISGVAFGVLVGSAVKSLVPSVFAFRTFGLPTGHLLLASGIVGFESVAYLISGPWWVAALATAAGVGLSVRVGVSLYPKARFPMRATA
jgi:O-antigen/teichoic acid export membrane protein